MRGRGAAAMKNRDTKEKIGDKSEGEAAGDV
jgi:hypothetical protein